jgi:O-antigen/teichoic acid export membrane protein
MNRSSSALKQRVIKAGGWAMGSFVAAQIIRLVGNLLLTRLLFPEAFGLMAVVYVLMSGLAMFSDLGINQGIIRDQRGEEEDYLNTSWTIQILRGVLICILALLIAILLPMISSLGWIPQRSVYADPLLPPLIAVFSLAVLVGGFESTKVVSASRQLRLGLVSKIDLFSQFIGLVVMVGMAWASHSVWSLVVGAIISGVVKIFLGHALLPGARNRLRWDSTAVKNILHFGIRIFLLSILGFLSASSDRIILGVMVDSTTLGIYSIAFILTSMANMVFGTILGKVIYPALGEILRTNPENISKVYNKLQVIADIFLFGAAGFLFVAGPSIVDILYDHRYHDAGHMLSILAIGLIGSRYMVLDQCCLVMGEMRRMATYRIVGLISMFLLIPVGFSLAGFEGTLIGIVISQFAGWPILLHFKNTHMKTDWKQDIVGIPTFAAAYILGWGVEQLLGHWH